VRNYNNEDIHCKDYKLVNVATNTCSFGKSNISILDDYYKIKINTMS
jgi:hypothetical protein